MKSYFACYDYGMGGLWWKIQAPSADAIRSAFPQLTVFETEPNWWADRPVNPVREHRLGDALDDVLTKIVQSG